MSNIIKNPAQHMAIELYAMQPSITAEEVAKRCNVTVKTVQNWRNNINFVEAVYDRYMVEFGSQLPDVLRAMVREAQAGNVQAGRLVLEHSGKLVKNVNVTIDSPFEKFLKKIDDIEDAEIIEDVEVTELVQDLPNYNDLPPRNEENQEDRVKKEKKSINKSIKDEIKRKEYNKKQKEWYNWRKRAEKAGIEPLKSKRPTKGQRKEWQNKIIAAEKE